MASNEKNLSGLTSRVATERSAAVELSRMNAHQLYADAERRARETLEAAAAERDASLAAAEGEARATAHKVRQDLLAWWWATVMPPLSAWRDSLYRVELVEPVRLAWHSLLERCPRELGIVPDDHVLAVALIQLERDVFPWMLARSFSGRAFDTHELQGPVRAAVDGAWHVASFGRALEACVAAMAKGGSGHSAPYAPTENDLEAFDLMRAALTATEARHFTIALEERREAQVRGELHKETQAEAKLFPFGSVIRDGRKVARREGIDGALVTDELAAPER